MSILDPSLDYLASAAFSIALNFGESNLHSTSAALSPTAVAQTPALIASALTPSLSTGLGDLGSMRRAFLGAFGQRPQALRRAARSAGA